VQSLWDVNAGDLTSAVLRYRKQAGGSVERPFVDPGKLPSSAEFFAEADLPDGEWRVLSRRGVAPRVSRFPKELVARCYLNWAANRGNRVTMAVSSLSRSLRPGEQIRLAVDYGTE
jgi:hypothetical protein